MNAAKPISTRVMSSVASPRRNQAITQGGEDSEMLLIVATGYAAEPEGTSSIGQSIVCNIEKR
jgi:hypothetical protein